MRANVVIRKNEGVYEGALVLDGKFNRSVTGTSADEVVGKLAGPLLRMKQDDGAEIGVDITIVTRVEAERAERVQRLQRETNEATQEAELLEKLKAAQKREADAAL